METIGERIKRLRLSTYPNKKMTQKEVATKLGIKASSVTQWERDSNGIMGVHLLALARLFRVTPEYILGIPEHRKAAISGVQEHQQSYTATPAKAVPLSNWTEPGTSSNSAHSVITSLNVSERAFALKVESVTMTNPNGTLSIPQGAIIIVEPQSHANQGDIVIAKLPGMKDATLKKMLIDGPNRYLEPLNPRYEPIKIDQDCEIIGVVKQVIQNL